MLGKVLRSPKLLSKNNYLLLPDEECENAAKTELMIPDDFYQINNNNSNNVFLHRNILSVSYHIDALNTFIINCKNKPKINTSDYVDTLHSHAFFPTINSPTQINANSKTLIDSIFYNDVTKNIISANISTSISDHLTQFLLISNQNPSPKNQMLNQMKKDHLEILIQWLSRKT